MFKFNENEVCTHATCTDKDLLVHLRRDLMEMYGKSCTDGFRLFLELPDLPHPVTIVIDSKGARVESHGRQA